MSRIRIRIRIAVALVIVAITAAIAFLVTRSVAIESIAEARRDEWAARPEIENWADPYAGLDWLSGAMSGAAIVLLAGIPVALAVVFAGRLWAVARDARRTDR